MKGFVLISAICIQLGWNYARGYSSGVGAFSSQDSTGKRYEGTYGLRDGEVVDVKGNLPPDFKPTDYIPNSEPDNFIGFFSDYYRNFENLLQDPEFPYYAPTPQIPYIPPTYAYSQPAYKVPDYGLAHNSIPDYTYYGPVSNNIPNYDDYNHNLNRAFQDNLDSQQIALDAAHKAFDLTSNQAGYSPNLTPSRFPLNSFQHFPNMARPHFPPGFPFQGGFPFEGGFPMNSRSGASSSAFAGAAAGPGFNQHVAVINPANPKSPNVFKSSRSSDNPGGYKSVSVSSYSTSSDLNGRRVMSQGADTRIDDNGEVSSYSVHSK